MQQFPLASPLWFQLPFLTYQEFCSSFPMERHLLTDLSKKIKEQMLSCIVYKRTFNPSMFVIPCMITVHQVIPTPIFPNSYVPSVLFISLNIRFTKFSPFCCLDLRCRSSYCGRMFNPAFLQVQVSNRCLLIVGFTHSWTLLMPSYCSLVATNLLGYINFYWCRIMYHHVSTIAQCKA